MSQEIQFILYNLPNEDGKVQVIIKDETLWCTQKAMAQLFDVGVPAISKHLKNIFEEGELNETVVVSKMEITTQHGAIEGKTQQKETKFYSLDAIISVGYRVNSSKATHFRIWTTKILKEFIEKGFVLDDERLKQGKTVFGVDYFRELLEGVRSIRASERRIWQQITDIYAECSIDYDKNSPTTNDFYAMIQNRFHYAIMGQTAAEIIYERADAERLHMGLTTWKNAPDGRIIKSDVTIAKNYLSEKEVDSLNLLSNAFIDMAELRARDHVLMTMADWKDVLRRYMELNNKGLLPDAGHITHEQAEEKALMEYEKFRVIQDREIMSDFDCQLKMLFEGNNSTL